jgi:uncharacterized protein
MSAGAASGFRDTGPTAALLADGRRLHLQHGPIDLIIQADGPHSEVLTAYRQATERFQTILTELVDELPALRLPVDRAAALTGSVARRMCRATLPHTTLAHAKTFITPMAAVAGAVGDEILSALVEDRVLSRAYVNNGGDIALYLGEGERYVAALIADPATARIVGHATLTAAAPVRGIATSGRHGRSHSLGIADAVTVLAPDAAAADAAATMIANAVNLPGSTKVERAPARDLHPDSDLGDRLVTVGLGVLNALEIETALENGRRHAVELHTDGLLKAAFLALGGRTCTVDAGNFIASTSANRLAIDLEPELEKTG